MKEPVLLPQKIIDNEINSKDLEMEPSMKKVNKDLESITEIRSFSFITFMLNFFLSKYYITLLVNEAALKFRRKN